MLWGDYVYLDVEERRRFVSSTHEYLIEQVQYTAPIAIAPGATSASLQLEFNHPVRELFWYVQRDDMARYHEYFNYSSVGVSEVGDRLDMLQDAVLQFDGFDRFQKRDAGYFRLVQPWQHHTVIPEDFYMYSYSFAIRPEDSQPCGSFNASRIDSIILQLNLNPDVVSPPRVSTISFTVSPFLSGVFSLTVDPNSTPVVGASIAGPGIAINTLIRSYNPNTRVITVSIATTSAQSSIVTLTQSQASTCIVGTLHSRVYGINHNVFRVADGFGGVLFTI
jgi:hypothetical protein